MTKPTTSRPMLQRYTASQRINHWLTALTFIFLAVSGLALFHPSFYWMSHLLGGGPWTRILHPFIGVVMFISFTIFSIRMIPQNLFIRQDFIWMRHVKEVLNDEGDKIPPVGKYNAGQKVLFWILVLCMITLLLTGIVMWRSLFSMYFSIGVIRIATVLHALAAFGIICSIIVHVYAAFWVKGSIQAMTRGWVTPGWAWKHHRLWFREWARKQPHDDVKKY